MANQRKNNNKMNMNMSRPSLLWPYGLIGAFIIGYYVFGDVNDTPVPSDWATVERMVEKGEVEKIQVVNRDQAQVFLKKEAVEQYRRDTVDKRFRRLPETGVQLLFTIGSVDSFREDLKAAEQPQRDNPLKHVEDIVEQNDNNFDGIINNTPQTPTVADLEQRAKAGEAISVTDLAKAVKAEKREQPQKKPSILKKLDEYKKQAAQQPKDKQKEQKKDLEV